MANSTLGNPWVLDSTGAVVTTRCKPKGIRWVGATTAGHTVILHDKNGKVKWASVANASNYVEADAPDHSEPWNGLTVNTIGSGTLYIEF